MSDIVDDGLRTAWSRPCLGDGCPCCWDEEGGPEPDWRPMSEAPRDGSHITVYNSDDEFGAWFDRTNQCWRDEEGQVLARDEEPWGWKP